MADRRSWTAACLIAILTSITYADDLQLQHGAVGLHQRLLALQSPTSVLQVVAHPDDEDGATLAYCARELGLRTMLFSLTRGEGGANLISRHFFDELGALRTLEHLKAASYYGNELFYSRAADYGYSKSLEEAMRKWQNGGPLLEDLVEVIRRERPTILMSRFEGDSRDGHGHHQMAGVLSRQAITAAADASRFPAQIARGLRPWQVKKFYIRAGSPWRPPQAGDWTVELNVGQQHPVIGRSPAQIARFGLGFQRSQGISGHASDPGPQSSYYRLEFTAAGDIPDVEHSLLDGLDTSWQGLATAPSHSHELLAKIDQQLKSTLANWSPLRRSDTVRSLAEVRRLLADIPLTSLPQDATPSIARLRGQLDAALADFSGLDLVAWATMPDGEAFPFAVPGEAIKIHARVTNQATYHARLNRISLILGQDHQLLPLRDIELLPTETQEASTAIQLPEDISLTRPHWSRPNLSAAMYQVDQDSQQRPVPLPVMRVSANLSLNQDESVDIDCPVEVRPRDPEFGNIRYALAVVPKKSVRFALDHRVVPVGRNTFRTLVKVGSHVKQKSTAQVSLELPNGWASTPAVASLAFDREGEEHTVTFQVTVPNGIEEDAYDLRAVVRSAGVEYREGFETVTARDLERLNVYRSAHQTVQVVDVRVLGTPRVGYIAGSGDRVAESLSPLDISPILLSDSDIQRGDLSSYDVILVGVRAYAVRDALRTHNARLLAYVKRGGVLIVQYQTPEFDENFGPYPYEMGRGPEEVSEELAAVTILRPMHPLFQLPNPITSKDFDGWFEQRGSKFWRTWDEHYEPLLECHDRGQAPQQGGQLIARYGNGVYIYSAYAWYRQLPQGVPGAYRLFANLLSLPETKLVQQ